MHAMVHGPMWASWLFTASTGFIVFWYSCIAWQFLDALRNPRVGAGDGSKATRALGEMIAIFVLCALSGYVPKLVFKFFPDFVPEMWPYMLTTHVLLAFWSGKYVFGRQTSHIMARLN